MRNSIFARSPQLFLIVLTGVITLGSSISLFLDTAEAGRIKDEKLKIDWNTEEITRSELTARKAEIEKALNASLSSSVVTPDTALNNSQRQVIKLIDQALTDPDEKFLPEAVETNVQTQKSDFTEKFKEISAQVNNLASVDAISADVNSVLCSQFALILDEEIKLITSIKEYAKKAASIARANKLEIDSYNLKGDYATVAKQWENIANTDVETSADPKTKNYWGELSKKVQEARTNHKMVNALRIKFLKQKADEVQSYRNMFDQLVSESYND